MCQYFNAVIPTENGLKIDRQQCRAKSGDCGVPGSRDDSRDRFKNPHTLLMSYFSFGISVLGVTVTENGLGVGGRNYGLNHLKLVYLVKQGKVSTSAKLDVYLA